MSHVTDGGNRLRLHGLWEAVGIGLVVTVVALSLLPLPAADLGANSDKLGHSLAYSSLMYWFAMVYPAKRRHPALAICFVALGVGLEFLQGMTSYRSFEVADMVANTAGVAIGWCFALTPLKSLLAGSEKLLLRNKDI